MNRLYTLPDFDDEFGFDDLDSNSIEFFTNVTAQAESDTATSKKRYVPRDREVGLTVLMDDYFIDDPKYNEATFRARFRMSKALFLKIVNDIETNFEWFQEGVDGRLKKSFTALQKCASAVKQLATGNPPNEFDEYLSMSERTSRECLEYFCNSVVILYGDEFLRKPTSHDIALLYNAHEEKHGLPGMLGSIDCTHWVWRNCPTRLRGQYMRGDHQYPTIMLEAVTSNDLWFWHAFFGPPGSNNDINVVEQSTIFTTELLGTAPKFPFHVNGRQYQRGYYLTNGIYPTWSTFVKLFPYPTNPKEKKFKKVQESARKDVERAFGILKAKWGIIKRSARAFKKDKIMNQMYACVILHNMILKDDGNAISTVYIRDPPTVPVLDDNVLAELHDSSLHIRLRFDLVEHVDRHIDILDSDDE